MANSHIIQAFNKLKKEYPFYFQYMGSGSIVTGSLNDVIMDSGVIQGMDSGEPSTYMLSTLRSDFATLPERNKLINEVSGSAFHIMSVKYTPTSPILDILVRLK